jgi:hypothetical protein
MTETKTLCDSTPEGFCLADGLIATIKPGLTIGEIVTAATAAVQGSPMVEVRSGKVVAARGETRLELHGDIAIFVGADLLWRGTIDHLIADLTDAHELRAVISKASRSRRGPRGEDTD